MSWWISARKALKHAALAGAGAAAAMIQQSPAEIPWEQVATTALITAVLAGLGGGGLNAAKHVGGVGR